MSRVEPLCGRSAARPKPARSGGTPPAKPQTGAGCRSLLHRDLKPENILLADSGLIKVLDFGIAKHVSTELAKTLPAKGTSPTSGMHLTQSGSLVGTLPYMSPEQWAALPIDERTDIWAAGVMLFELSTGAHPLDPLDAATLAKVSALDVPMPSAREKLPHSPEFADVIDRCLKKRREERLVSAKALLEALEALGAKKQAMSGLAEGTSPFTGLSAFQESDAARFFGRDDDVSAVVGRLRQQQLLTIVGASGAGKSSFVRAGVIPALKRAGRDVETFILRPGRRPIAALADVLAFLSDTSGGAEEADPATLAKTLRTEPGYLGARLRARCRKRGADHRVLLFVDQLEELYTQGIDLAEQAAFCACIEGVADDAASPLRVMMTIRADYLDRASEDRAFSTAMTRGLFFLPPMTQLGLREALERPLAAIGYRFEDETLCNEMLGALDGTKNPLPVLQFAANQLWEARDREGKQLTRAAYEALGGVSGALSTHADAVVSGMSLPAQRMAMAILIRLVSPERTRAVVRLDELFSLSDDRRRLEQVVQLLADARLLSIDSGSEREGKTVELTHESLIQRWSKLRQWLDENEKDAGFVAELRSAAAQWEKNDRAEGLLWRDRAADEAGQWLERNQEKTGVEGALRVSTRERLYLEAVARLSQRTKWRRRQALGAAFAFLSLIALVVSVLGLKAKKEARRADAKAAEAEKSAEEAHHRAKQARNASRMASVREHLSDPTLVLSLVRELEAADSLPPKWKELARWATFQVIAKVVLSHQDAVHSASFSPDGTRIVTASRDKIARVWTVGGKGVPILLVGHEAVVHFASFSPDGTRIVTASADKTARVWNADGKGEPIVLQGHQGGITSASFSPDGARIVTASGDKTVRIWNADGKGVPIVLEGHQNIVSSASFSPDGARIVTASWDKTARVWNADGKGVPILLAGHQDIVISAAFSPDGARIVTASSDKTARVWNADGKGVPLLLEGHVERVNSASFSPDGARIVTASFDRTARVFSADGTGTPLQLHGHQDSVNSASFSPDGARIVTASGDKTARVWNADGKDVPIFLEGHQDRVTSASFSPDGARVVTASLDKTARVWKSDGKGVPILLQGHEDRISSASFSPDGARVVTASWDKTARVWNADGKGAPIVLTGHQDRISSASFSPDGARIVTASWDKTARVWNADGKGVPILLAGHQDIVISAAFSPNGARIVTASSDKTARVWNADGKGVPLLLEGHVERVNSASFSPDGARIVTASFDRTARVFSADGKGLPILLRGHTAAVSAGSPGGGGAFSPDGARIVTISDDATLRVWSADGKGEPAILRMPDVDAWSAAFSPDGKHIVTTSHSRVDPATGKITHWATIWPTFEPLKSPNDAELWLATRYCPPVDLRMELLGLSKEEAAAQLEACQARVDAAFEHESGRR